MIAMAHVNVCQSSILVRISFFLLQQPVVKEEDTTSWMTL
jgi:hypothetical protein